MPAKPHAFPQTIEGQLSLVLWLAWDPLGGAPDEYTSYAPSVLELLQAGSAAEDIAALLARLRFDWLGALPDADRDLRAAWTAQDWYQWFVEGEDPPALD